MPDPLLSMADAVRITGLSRTRIQQLTDLGVLSAHRTAGGHRRFEEQQLIREWTRHLARNESSPRISDPQPGHDLLFSRIYPRDGLSEDAVWKAARDALEQSRSPLPAAARAILAYATTEMVNNAIDHSEGATVTVEVVLAGRRVHIRVHDDGVGAFARLARLSPGSSAADAVVEITKGRRTTAPDEHAGEGIFFTSKAVDVFSLSANGFRVVFDNHIGDVAFGSDAAHGTTVELSVDLDTERTLRQVFDAYSDQESGFHRTTPRIQLIAAEGEFISRSEAKRFAEGLEKFDRVELDFTGVDLIGQGFADQLFRIWQAEHPQTELIVRDAGPGILLMISHVTARR